MKTEDELKAMFQQVLEKAREQLSPFDGLYYIDKQLIKSVCGEDYRAVCLYAVKSQQAKYTDDEIGLIVRI